MPGIDQEVDGIIEEEKLEQGISKDEDESKENDKEEDKSNEDEQDAEKSEDESKSDDEESEDKDAEDESDKEESEDESEDSEDEEESNLEEQVEKAKSIISELQDNGADVFDKDGNPKKFEDVVPAGPYFLSVLNPVKVVDKSGKTHEFLLLTDVEKKFPDGFEAKSNIEQMKFEKAIMANESKFEDAIGRYNEAKAVYQEEVTDRQQESKANQSIADEYKAMAKSGMVPKVGDPDDPDFKDSEAVKTLDTLLTWMDTKNAELKKQGLGQITSLYVAKQLMDIDENKDEKQKNKQEIDKQRKDTARLNKSPDNGTKDDSKSKKIPSSQPMSTYIEQLLAEEDIK